MMETAASAHYEIVFAEYADSSLRNWRNRKERLTEDWIERPLLSEA